MNDNRTEDFIKEVKDNINEATAAFSSFSCKNKFLIGDYLMDLSGVSWLVINRKIEIKNGEKIKIVYYLFNLKEINVWEYDGDEDMTDFYVVKNVNDKLSALVERLVEIEDELKVSNVEIVETKTDVTTFWGDRTGKGNGDGVYRFSFDNNK